MLDKEICKKCQEKEIEYSFKEFDYLWSKGYVRCIAIPKHLSKKHIKICKNPPPYCPYILEHLLKQDK